MTRQLAGRMKRISALITDYESKRDGEPLKPDNEPNEPLRDAEPPKNTPTKQILATISDTLVCFLLE